MKFQPKTEKELQEALVVEPGIYDFEVVNAIEKQSKSGNDMIELKLKIFVGEGARIISDYLLESMAFKLRHFCEAVGLLDKYENGTLSAFDCAGVAGKLELVIQRDKSGSYPDRNSVKDYVVDEDYEPKASTPPLSPGGVAPASFNNDDIPF